MKKLYLNAVTLSEKLHRTFLEVVKLELDRNKIYDINSIQAIIIYQIGKERLTVSEIRNRGYYLGSNVTYNLKKMVESGYIKSEGAQYDKRTKYLELTKDGIKVFELIDKLIENHIENLESNGISEIKLRECVQTLSKLDNFWNFMIMQNLKF